jgi:hypothetical protein
MCEILTGFERKQQQHQTVSEFSELKSAVTKILGIQHAHTQTR